MRSPAASIPMNTCVACGRDGSEPDLRTEQVLVRMSERKDDLITSTLTRRNPREAARSRSTRCPQKQNRQPALAREPAVGTFFYLRPNLRSCPLLLAPRLSWEPASARPEPAARCS